MCDFPKDKNQKEHEKAPDQYCSWPQPEANSVLQQPEIADICHRYQEKQGQRSSSIHSGVK